MPQYTIVRHDNAFAFGERASPWLLQAEAENNLLLSIIEQLKANPPTYDQPYLATVEENGHLAGCAFRTPPHKLGLTRMPHGAVPMLINDVAQMYDELPAVLGPEPCVRMFADGWGAIRGALVRTGMRHRIYELDEVQFPEQMPTGEMRLAARRDLDLVVTWLHEFGREAKVGTVNTAAFVEGHINNKTLFLWEDEGEPRTSAVYAGKTPHGVRIGFVYTPPQFRRRGYASACVATASKRALDNGVEFCCLYTDLNNPTSNDIYQRIGYVPVCDVTDYEFG
jgi:predicted GNAT family acetyltransferase